MKKYELRKLTKISCFKNSPRSVVSRSNITNVIASVDGRVTGFKPPGTTGSGKFSMSGC